MQTCARKSSCAGGKLLLCRKKIVDCLLPIGMYARAEQIEGGTGRGRERENKRNKRSWQRQHLLTPTCPAELRCILICSTTTSPLLTVSSSSPPRMYRLLPPPASPLWSPLPLSLLFDLLPSHVLCLLLFTLVTPSPLPSPCCSSDVLFLVATPTPLPHFHPLFSTLYSLLAGK
jgi:hypothetical protein